MNMFRLGFLIPIPILSAGCPGPCVLPCVDEVPEIEGLQPEEHTDEPCLSSLGEVYPEHGAENVYYRAAMEIEFFPEHSSSNSAISVQRADGAVVEGLVTWSEDGSLATFTPAQPLLPDTTYKVEVEYLCEKSASFTWTTGSAGAPVDETALAGGVYGLDLSTGRATPRDAEVLLSSLLGVQPPDGVAALVSAVQVDETSVTLRVATTVDGEPAPDVCAVTSDTELTGGLLDGPYFELEGTDISLSVEGQELRLASLQLSGAFTPDGAAIEGGRIDMTFDPRTLGEGMESFCEILGADACVPCPDGEVLCVNFGMDRLRMERVNSDSLAQITVADVDANPVCSPL